MEQNTQQKAEKWFKKCIWCLVFVIGIVVGLVYLFDPYFHFHKPFEFVSYRLYEERYINDGISRNFEYDAIITGTSMAQNFKTSEVDALYGTTCVKETFAGAGYKEISQNLERALSYNKDLKTVFWTMDYNALMRDKDWCSYDNYPTYLYDDNICNDTSYIFNKSVLYHGVLTNLVMTLTGQPSTTMDEYSAWHKENGLEYILQNYTREGLTLRDEQLIMTEDEHKMVTDAVQQNFINLINQYPDTQFYIFYTPYSIFYWDFMEQEGMLLRQLEAEKIATELLLQCPNVRLYNFFDNYDLICNPENYRDKEHYGETINSWILQQMKEDTYLVTEENYLDRLEAERTFYMSYDYDTLYEQSLKQVGY